MFILDYMEALDHLGELYAEEGKEGPSFKWIKKHARSPRCTAVERQVCKDILANNVASWFLVARSFHKEPTVLNCTYSTFRQICEWHDANPGKQVEVQLATDDLIVIVMTMPRGVYTLHMGPYASVMYYFATWFDQDTEEWGALGAESDASTSCFVRGDKRVSLRTLIAEGGVITNSLLVASYCSLQGLISPGRPCTVDVQFQEPEAT